MVCRLFNREYNMTTRLPIANSYGNVDIRLGIPEGYEHVEGLGLQPLCRKLGISYSQALIGFTNKNKSSKPILDGLVVKKESVPGLRTAIAEREKRSQKRRQKEQEKRERQLANDQDQRLIAFRKRFPAANDETTELYLNRTHVVFANIEAVPLNMLTRNEIEELGLMQAAELGVLLEDGGATLVPLFTATPSEDTSSQSDEEVYRQAEKAGFPPQKALWALNKLVKILTKQPKREVYTLKDALLRHWSQYIVEGRIARNESSVCWSCNGSGTMEWEEDCYRCGGSGTYSSKTLYESRYLFPGDERIYCFHSYSKPAVLSNEQGANKASYGSRLTPDECQQLPFGFHDLLRIVRFEVGLQDAALKERERTEVLNVWKTLGLPPVIEDAETQEIKSCPAQIERLTAQ
jgi:hypothetical protein